MHSKVKRSSGTGSDSGGFEGVGGVTGEFLGALQDASDAFDFELSKLAWL